MNAKELRKRLRVLAECIHKNVPSVNYGGCAVVAGHVAKALNGLGIEAEVITPSYGLAPASVRENVTRPHDPDEWRDAGVAHQHLAVRFRLAGRVYTWDSNGLRRSAKQFGGKHWMDPKRAEYTAAGKFGSGHTADEALAMTRRPSGWNSAFNRKYGIPRIKAAVQYHLALGL